MCIFFNWGLQITAIVIDISISAILLFHIAELAEPISST